MADNMVLAGALLSVNSSGAPKFFFFFFLTVTGVLKIYALILQEFFFWGAEKFISIKIEIHNFFAF